jgi:hypothetical protein
MSTIIAEYASFARAQRAVRSMEPHFSIQDIVIRAHGGSGSAHLGGSFTVVMGGADARIREARALLSDWDRAHP